VNHNHFWTWFWKHGCPVCKVKQLKYGDKTDPEYDKEIEEIMRGKLFTIVERQWILRQIGYIR